MVNTKKNFISAFLVCALLFLAVVSYAASVKYNNKFGAKAFVGDLLEEIREHQMVVIDSSFFLNDDEFNAWRVRYETGLLGDVSTIQRIEGSAKLHWIEVTFEEGESIVFIVTATQSRFGRESAFLLSGFLP